MKTFKIIQKLKIFDDLPVYLSHERLREHEKSNLTQQPGASDLQTFLVLPISEFYLSRPRPHFLCTLCPRYVDQVFHFFLELNLFSQLDDLSMREKLIPSPMPTYFKCSGRNKTSSSLRYSTRYVHFIFISSLIPRLS